MRKTYFVLWLINLLGWCFYSFTQIDLNLTLTKVPILNAFFKSFQYIGYFQRPLSTYLFLFLLASNFILYLLLLRDFSQGKVTRRWFWRLILSSCLVLFFSYPAFSYDLFNYMFDAKTIIYYHANPWISKPLDFTGDPWLLFMRWTHRPSVYPAGWIFLSLPFYLLGLNFFLTILFSFKLLMALSYLGTIWVMEKILTIQKVKASFFLLAIFALNPLIIIESLISAHNDIVMIFFVVLGLWLGMQEKRLLGILSLILSGTIKYLGAGLSPVFFWSFLRKKPLALLELRIALFLMVGGLIYIVQKIEIQPWYLIWLLPLLVIAQIRILFPVAIAFSIGLLLRYTPFLFLGNWDPPVPTYKLWLTLTPLTIGILFVLIKNKLWLKK